MQDAPNLGAEMLSGGLSLSKPRRRAAAASRTRSSRLTSVVRWIALGAISLVMLVPFYVLLISAFKPQAEIIRHPLTISARSST
jgi:raffinose/stachyose/melibiose transport system permease protein